MTRVDLAQLRAAGLVRCRFSARVDKITRRGLVILKDVYTPTGRIDHVWTKPEEWDGYLPKVGHQIEFLASIDPYLKGSAEQDLGLFQIRVMR
jgi:hypothetical protein